MNLPALAESADIAAQTAAGEAVAMDLDGDGADETVRWAYAPGEYGKTS